MASPKKTSSPQIESRTYLPDDWNDDKRISVRFAEFKPREANPEGWELKMNFWMKAINKWCTTCNVVRFTLNDVREAFRKGDLRPDPNCLRLVITNMMKQESIVTCQDFVKRCSQKENGWLDWGINSVIKKPITLGWSLFSNAAGAGDTLTETVDDAIDAKTVFIDLEAIKSCSKLILQRFESLDDKCIKYDDLVDLVNNEFKVSVKDLDYILMFMESEKKAKIYTEKDLKLIKFGENVVFTEADISLIKLNLAKQLIENDIERCETEMAACKEEARMCLKEGNKLKAKVILKRKKRLEALIDKKATQLDNVLYLVDQFSQSDMNKLVLDVYKKCTAALKVSTVSAEELDNTMVDLEDILSESGALVSHVSNAFDYQAPDEESIEEELELLLNEEKPTPVKQPPRTVESSDDGLKELMDRLEALRKPIGEVEEPASTKNKLVSTAN